MAAVLSDLAVEVEAAAILSFQLAHSFDSAASDPRMAAWRRLMTPVEILGLQNGTRLRLRGDGVPRRQRLRRGRHRGADLSRTPGQCDLGRIRQRHGARSAARAAARARDGRDGARTSQGARRQRGAPQGAVRLHPGDPVRAPPPRPARAGPYRSAGDLRGRGALAGACPGGGGGCLHPLADRRQAAADLRSGLREGRYARHPAAGAAGSLTYDATSAGVVFHGRAAHGPYDLAQSGNEAGALAGLEHGENMRVDAGGGGAHRGQRRPPLRGDPHRVHAGVLFRTFPLEELALHEAAHDIG